MIPRKQNTDQAMWLESLAKIDAEYPTAQFEALLAKTVKQIKKVCGKKKVALAWSGGKDSLVLQKVCEQVGIDKSVLVISNLEYPSFLTWVAEYRPAGLEIINTGQDILWLEKNQKMLFPKEAAIASRWFHIVQHRGQSQYFKENNLKLLLLGRRKADGNYVGTKGENIYTNKQGITRYSPISDWTHEDVLKAISYFQITLPPLYFCKDGFKIGTGPWPARPYTGTVENGWQEVYDIEPGVVVAAAEHIEMARFFLLGKGVL